MFLQQIRVRIANIDQFEGVLHRDLVPAGEVIHQKLDEIEEISGLEASLIEDASLIHEGKLVLIDFAIEILIDFPDPLVDFGLAVGEAELGQHADDVLLVDGQPAWGKEYGFLL